MNKPGNYYLNNLHSTYIGISRVHGYGLFAQTDLMQGEVLGVLDGQLMTWDAYKKVVDYFSYLEQSEKKYFFMEWNCISSEYLLVRPFRTFYSLINHSRTPNLYITLSPLSVMVSTAIKKGEELFLDYRKEPLPDFYLNNNENGYL